MEELPPSMAQPNSVPSGPPAPKLVSSRVFNTRRDALFQAFTRPDVLARWWGPKGFTNLFEEFDPRPGGMWRFVMLGPDGTEYRRVKQFVELVPLERIVLDHVDAVHGFRMVMTFHEEGARTRLTWQVQFESAEEAERVGEAFLESNEQNFERLKAQLAEQ